MDWESSAQLDAARGIRAVWEAVNQMKRIAFALLLATGLAAQPVPLFDGRSYLKAIQKPGKAEAATVKAEVLRRSQEKFLKKRLEGLTNGKFDEAFEIRGMAKGSFTRAGSAQQAVLYRYSYTNGVVVLEGGKVVAHYSGDPGDYALFVAIFSAPDMNKNGLSEMVMLRNVEDTPNIYAYFYDSGAFQGATTVFSSNVLPGEDPVPDDKIEDLAYAVSAEPGPKFQRVTYRRGKQGAWTVKAAAAPFALDKKGGPAKLTRID